MKKNLSVYIFAVLAMLVVISCSRKPFRVLDQDEMANIMFDLYIAEAMTKNSTAGFSTNDAQKALINSVMLKNGVTKAVFDSSLVWYSDNMQELTKVNDLVTARLTGIDSIYEKRMNRKLIYKFSDFKEKLPRVFYLDSTTPSLVFRIDSTILRNNGLTKDVKLRFDVLGIDTMTRKLDATIYYHLKDTTLLVRNNILADSNYLFVLNYDIPVVKDIQAPDSINNKFSMNDIDAVAHEIIGVEAYIRLLDTLGISAPVILNNIELELIK